MSDELCFARFADESKRVRPSGLVKLFEPHHSTQTLSLFTTTEAPETDVLRAGKYAASERKRAWLYGWSWVCTKTLSQIPLSVDIDGNPTIGKCRHVNLRGWPSDVSQALSVVHRLIDKLAPGSLHKLPTRIASGYKTPDG